MKSQTVQSCSAGSRNIGEGTLRMGRNLGVTPSPSEWSVEVKLVGDELQRIDSVAESQVDCGDVFILQLDFVKRAAAATMPVSPNFSIPKRYSKMEMKI
jgi:hypothetical protein